MSNDFMIHSRLGFHHGGAMRPLVQLEHGDTN
jgi:hypothetical protein